jgi:ParB family transcriptional regulator, chromosome partitioning protein
MKTITIKVADILVGEDRRVVDMNKVAELAESIKEVGLLQKPVVREIAPGQYKLVAGNHRLTAVKQLGMTELEVEVVGLDDINARIAELDENIMRNHNPLEVAIQMAERKKLYEIKHPEAAINALQKAGGSAVSRQTLPASFVKATAKVLNKSERSVREDVQIGSNLTPEEVKIFTEKGVTRTDTINYLAIRGKSKEVGGKILQRIVNGEKYIDIIKTLAGKKSRAEELMEERDRLVARIAEIDMEMGTSS